MYSSLLFDSSMDEIVEHIRPSSHPGAEERTIMNSKPEECIPGEIYEILINDASVISLSVNCGWFYVRLHHCKENSGAVSSTVRMFNWTVLFLYIKIEERVPRPSILIYEYFRVFVCVCVCVCVCDRLTCVYIYIYIVQFDGDSNSIKSS